MAYIGLKNWMIARIDPKTNTVITDDTQGGLTTNCDIPGVFRVDLSSAAGATEANISNLQGTITKTYGSNSVARAASGTPEPTVALAANNVPFDVIQKITGMIKDPVGGGYTRTTDAEINHCALLINSSDWDGNDVYIGFYDGTVTKANTNIQTNNQSEKITADTLTYTALGVDAQVGQNSVTGQVSSVGQGGAIKTLTGNSVKVYSMWSAAAAGFDYNKMTSVIFPQGKGSSSSSQGPAGSKG